ncbi:Glutamate synthase large subunit-like protein [Acididesulfobacillus acetoxydans]|uniref:Glutamate synthase large subunit-like protein n=1 Tax=Acididesulfobacillus acetoxydans TaxID=1561005 RepID=A0A8S0Y4J8_9FIRM|nr:FMN-binding glutamate synthase family protein [Acididesulfobacillus acetoxydans]CAA7603045.1 Glutamate synthase large subunit-like protein [Acididesulfobacillus acetoxydans]CEJ09004.1 Glutamate synthase large subunit-like protein [Acididesulfobacillus acetoxydans]
MLKRDNDVLRRAGKMVGLSTLGAAGIYVLGRLVFKRLVTQSASKILQEPYDRNIFEAYAMTKRMNPMTTVDTNLRAESGQPVMSFGTPFPMPSFEGIRFSPAQLYRFSTPQDVEIDTALVLGKKAAKPMKLDIPILITGMAFGNGLSKQAKLAAAEAATLAGTATNCGDGPFNAWERAAAKHYIVQYGRTKFNRDPNILRQADMIEIQFGHCGWVGLGSKYAWREFTPELRKAFALKRGEDLVYHANFPEVPKPQDLGRLITDLRNLTGGVPIGVKITCGHDIERDLALILEGGADVITLDGGQATSHWSPECIHDNFSLPTVSALCRAARFLDKEKVRDRVSLLVEGGLETPGDFLKALALGADGVEIGFVALVALLHNQEFKALPYEPPAQLLWYTGRYKNKFNRKEGAKYLANYLRACVEEMRLMTRGVGKTALRDVSADDLFAIDEMSAKIANLPLHYQSSP